MMTWDERIDLEMLVREMNLRLRALVARDTQSLRALRREFSKRLAGATPSTMIKLAFRLLKQPDNEHRFVAYELIHHHRETLSSLNAGELERLGQGMDNWGAVDTFACYLSGPAWREHQVPDGLIRGWAHSPDRWWRRAALVSTVPLNNRAQGGRGDAARTLKICRLLMKDTDEMVVKAMSWALRELAKRNPQAVRGFLEENENVLASRVLREVRNKLFTGLKTPRRA